MMFINTIFTNYSTGSSSGGTGSSLAINFVFLRSRGSACSGGFVATTRRTYRGTKMGVLGGAGVPRNGRYCRTTTRLISRNYSVVFTSDFNRRSCVVRTTGGFPRIRFLRTANAGTRARNLSGCRGTFTSVCRNHFLTNITTNRGLGRVVGTNGVATSRTGVNCMNTFACTRIVSNCASFCLNTGDIYPSMAVRIAFANS